MKNGTDSMFNGVAQFHRLKPLLALLAACALSACETTSDFYDVAQRESDCSVKLTFYRHTLEHALANDESDYLQLAMSGIKSTAPGCDSNPENTVMNLTSAVDMLNKSNHWQQSNELAGLAFTLIERHPELAINEVYFNNNSDFYKSAAHTNNTSLLQRLSAIEARMSGKSESEIQARTNRNLEMSNESFNAYANSGSDPTTQVVSAIGNATLAAAVVHQSDQAIQAHKTAAPTMAAISNSANYASQTPGSATVTPVEAVGPGSSNKPASLNSGWKAGQDASRCVTVESHSRADGPEAYIKNNCNQTINIAFCIVREDNAFNTSGNLLCSRGGGRETQLDAGQIGWIAHETQPGSVVTIDSAACVNPATPKNLMYGQPIRYTCMQPVQ